MRTEERVLESLQESHHTKRTRQPARPKDSASAFKLYCHLVCVYPQSVTGSLGQSLQPFLSPTVVTTSAECSFYTHLLSYMMVSNKPSDSRQICLLIVCSGSLLSPRYWACECLFPREWYDPSEPRFPEGRREYIRTAMKHLIMIIWAKGPCNLYHHGPSSGSSWSYTWEMILSDEISISPYAVTLIEMFQLPYRARCMTTSVIWH